MPRSIKALCMTNLFCWMAHVCYSLYFTDYVGEAVFGGDPMVSKNIVMVYDFFSNNILNRKSKKRIVL